MTHSLQRSNVPAPHTPACTAAPGVCICRPATPANITAPAAERGSLVAPHHSRCYSRDGNGLCICPEESITLLPGYRVNSFHLTPAEESPGHITAAEVNAAVRASRAARWYGSPWVVFALAAALIAGTVLGNTIGRL